jgi:2-methylisocitrate lyase-like PEP mutase family enzyme
MLIEELGFDGVYISGAVIANDLGLPDVGLTTLPEVSHRARATSRVTALPAIVDVDTGFGGPMNVARTVRELDELGLAGCHLEDQVNPKRCGQLEGKQVVDLGIDMVIYPVTAQRLAMGTVEAGLTRLRDEGIQEGLLDRMQDRERLYELVRYGDYETFDQNVYDFGGRPDATPTPLALRRIAARPHPDLVRPHQTGCSHTSPHPATGPAAARRPSALRFDRVCR